MKFKPSAGLTLTLFVIGLVFGRLGLWQLDREDEKRTLFNQFENAPMMSVEQALLRKDGFSRVEAYGHFDQQRHILLDNKIHQGRAGVHVFTPFYLENGSALLVNRGWLPLQPDRRQLPEIPTETNIRMISGLLKQPSTDGHRLGEPDVLTKDQWPQLVTYFDLEVIAHSLETSLPPWVLQLDKDNSAGFADREWQAAVMTPQVHRAYAWQWFSLALVTLIIWTTLSVRRGQNPPEDQD